MVLGFGRGPERFPAAKEQTPGPGAYDPKDLETKLPPKSGFLTGERFTSQELEENAPAARTEPSPPRERKPVNPGNDRSYSWATQRIHELNKELEAANKRIKELEKVLKEKTDKTDKWKKDLAAAAEQRDQLQEKLDEQEQELALIRGELASTKEQLSVALANEMKASKSAQAGAARVEQLVLELHQVRAQAAEACKELELQNSALADERQKAEMARADIIALQQQLGVEAAERAALHDRVTSLDEQCRQRAAELSDQTAKRAEAESRAESAETTLMSTCHQLQQALTELAESKAEAARSSDHAIRLSEELAAARAESTDRGEQLGAARAQLTAEQQQNEALSSQLRIKEASLEARSTQLTTQMSAIVELRVNLEAAQEGVKQRDETIANFMAKIDELTQELADQKSSLAAEMQRCRAELEAAGLREQTLTAGNAQLEQRLVQSVALCDQHAAAASSLQQQLEAAQADLAVQVEAVASATAKLEAAQVVIGQQTQQLDERAVRVSGLEGEVAALSANAARQTQADAASIGELRALLASKEAEATQLAERLDTERAALKARAEDVQQLSSTVKELEASTADLQTTLTARDAALSELANELDVTKLELQARSARITELMTEAEAFAEAEVATGELVNTLEASLSNYKRRVSELEASNEKLRGDLSVQHEACNSLSAELAAVKSAVDSGAAREAALHERVTSTEEQLAAVKAEKQQLEQRCSQFSSELAAEREAHSCLSRSREELQAELAEQKEAQRREGATYTQQLAKVQSELAATLAVLTAVQQEVEELHVRLQDAHVAGEKLASELTQAQADIASRSATIDCLQCTLGDMQRKAADLEAIKDQLAQTLSTMQQDLSSSNARCSSLESRVSELEASLGQAADQCAHLQTALGQLQAAHLEAGARAKADAEQASARLMALEGELAESRNAAAGLGAELAQLVTDLEEREQEIKELKVARHETASALTAVSAERADLHSQLEELRRRDMDLQAELAASRARTAQLEAEAQSLQALVTAAQDEAHLYRGDADALSADLDKARDQIRMLELQEGQMESLRQELESMCVRLREAETRNEVLQDKVVYMEGRVASMTPICSKAKLDDQVRALSDALEKSHLRSNELEDQVRRNTLLETSAALELRRLTDENEHLVARMMKLEDDLKEQSALGHNNHKQKIQYHLRLKQELEELRHECTVLLRDKFQLEQCIRYLAVQVGMGPDDRRQSLATAERKAIEKVLPACLAYNAIYSTPLSQRAMRLSARGKNNEQGTVYAGGKETFEEGISEARTKLVNLANNWRSDAQFAAAAVSPPVAEGMDAVATSTGVEAAKAADGCTRSDTCGSPDGKAARGPTAAVPGTPVATIRGAGTPVSGSAHGPAAAGASQTLAKLEERIRLMISDVCAPATSRNPDLPPVGAAAPDTVGATPAATVTVHRGGAHRDRDQDKGVGGASGSIGGASGSNGGAGGSNGGGAVNNAGGRERAPRPSMALGADVTTGRLQAGQNRRLTMAPGARTTFKG